MSGFRVEVSEVKKRKTASAFLRDGVLVVQIPAHWPRDFKQEVAQRLVRRVLQKEAKEYALMQRAEAESEKITLLREQDLRDYVERINAETFRVALGPVKIGSAKHTRLAQVNLKSRVMTVSRYCLHNVPEPALRYLIVHELAHFLEAGHTKRFWGLVAQFVPDYKAQSRIIKAFHSHAVQQDEPTPKPHGTLPPTAPAFRPAAASLMTPSPARSIHPPTFRPQAGSDEQLQLF